MQRVLFIDRDGVINRMVKYEYGWDSPQKSVDVRLVDGIEKIISWVNKKQIPVIEISNQPGVAKGKMDQRTSDAIEAKVHKLLKSKGAEVDNIFICPHHPDAVVPTLRKVCDCRKPKPGLLLKASKELQLDLETSILLGDSETDVQAAHAANVKSIIFEHNQNAPRKVRAIRMPKADFKTDSIDEASIIIKNFFKSA